MSYLVCVATHANLSPRAPTIDPDLRAFKRKEILDAIARRYAPTRPSRPSLDIPVKAFGGAKPLFDVDDEPEIDIVPTANDEALALALQQEELGSDEEEPDPDLARALAMSRQEAEKAKTASPIALEDDMETIEDAETAPSEVTAPSVVQVEESEESMDELEEVSLVPSGRTTPVAFSEEATPVADSDDEIEEVPMPQNTEKIVSRVGSQLKNRRERSVANAPNGHPRQAPIPSSQSSTTTVKPSPAPTRPPSISRLPSRQASLPHAPVRPSPLARSPSIEVIEPSSDGLMEEVPLPAGPSTPPRPIFSAQLPDFHPETPPTRKTTATNGTVMPEKLRSPHRRSAADLLAFIEPAEDDDALSDLRADAGRDSRSVSAQQFEEDEEDEEEDDDHDDSRSIAWSRSPSPRPKRPALQPAQSGETIPSEVDDEDVDMDREDMNAEEDDYARFMAQIKNRDLNEVRGEIDDEIRILNNQNKVAMRDSDEITQAMISQIQTLLRHFGIPYITAPMEAEAQCAKLAELNLVDGIITDDSDVFLFGGKQCFKNIFNDAKYAECFLLADINRELSLSRERLISLAYLLGSDYTIGLPGVGPVVALELLANFPGENGVWQFKEWWMKVQRGQDAEHETDSKWKKSFVRALTHRSFSLILVRRRGIPDRSTSLPIGQTILS